MQNLITGMGIVVGIATIIYSVAPANDAHAAPTTLAPGDVVIVTANSDSLWSTAMCDVSTNVHSNAFDLLLRVPITEGTVIKVTDKAWTGTELRTGEGTVTYTAATDMPAGTIIRYADCLYNDGGSGWERSVPLNGFDAAVSGDNLLVYQGDDATPSFIYGFGFRSNSWISTGTPGANNSYLPAELLAANAYSTSTNQRNFQYAGPIGIYTPDFLANLQDMSLWDATGGASAGVTFGQHSGFDAVSPSFNDAIRTTPTSNPTNASTVVFTITTSEPVGALSASDFTVATSGSVTYDVVTTTQVDTLTYTVTVTGASGEGSIALDEYVGTGLADVNGNPALVTTFASEVYDIDTVAPVGTVYVLSANQSSVILSGVVNDTTSTITVTIDGESRAATNHGDGSWSIVVASTMPFESGDYAVTVHFVDALGNASTQSAEFTIAGAPSPEPTPGPSVPTGGTPLAPGTGAGSVAPGYILVASALVSSIGLVLTSRRLMSRT